MPAEPQGAAETGPTPVAGPAVGLQRVVGQVRREVRADRDRADAGTAAAVRDAEGLVQVQVRDVARRTCRGLARPTSALRLAPST